MSKLHYTPASDGWLAVAGDRQLLLVESAASDAAELWAAASKDFQASLDVLTRGGFASMPSFALLERSEGGFVRVIVRGPVTVTMLTADGVRTLDGTGVSTWSEQLLADVSGAAVDVVASAADPSLPLVSGVVFASRVAWGAPVVEPASASASPEITIVDVPSPASEVTVAEPVEARPSTGSGNEGGSGGEGGSGSEAGLGGEGGSGDGAEPEGDSGYDYLFGETMYRNVSDAAVHEAPESDEAADAAAPPSEQAGDHDGMTLMSGDIRKLRAERRAAAQASRLQEKAPELFVELSTGGRESLSRPLLVGRAPTASKVSGGALPRLVTIPGDKDISRNHVQITVEGGTVVVTDLHSRNGTQIVLPGKSPQQLRQGEPTSVIVGTVVDLGGGVTLTVREEG